MFPSLFEGLGIVAIEAQCSGLPVVGSDVIPKEAAVTNQFHYMSLDDSADEWAKKILEVTKQERKAEIDKIRAAGYDVHDVAEYLQDFLYKEVFGKLRKLEGGKMKKVGLVSVRNYNYGSILQAYALQQELFAAGIDNELIYYKKR